MLPKIWSQVGFRFYSIIRTSGYNIHGNRAMWRNLSLSPNKLLFTIILQNWSKRFCYVAEDLCHIFQRNVDKYFLKLDIARSVGPFLFNASQFYSRFLKIVTQRVTTEIIRKTEENIHACSKLLICLVWMAKHGAVKLCLVYFTTLNLALWNIMDLTCGMLDKGQQHNLNRTKNVNKVINILHTNSKVNRRYYGAYIYYNVIKYHSVFFHTEN